MLSPAEEMLYQENRRLRNAVNRALVWLDKMESAANSTENATLIISANAFKGIKKDIKAKLDAATNSLNRSELQPTRVLRPNPAPSNRDSVSRLVEAQKSNTEKKVRIFAGGYITFNTAGMLASMTAAIVDAAYIHNEFRKSTPVFSVDTQEWKKVVLGNRKASKDDAVAYVKNQFVDAVERRSLAENVNHDSADAYCIGQYLWMAKPIKVKREK